MRFGILGPLVVTDDGGRELALGGHKQRSVLAILLLHANEVVSQDRLIEELWSGKPPASALTSLQAHVSRLRRAFGDDQRIVTIGGGYLIRVEPGELDRERFERLVEEGGASASTEDWERASSTLREALVLWRGLPLSDLQYESFAQAEIARLCELQVGALEQRIEADLALGFEARAIGALEQLVPEHPYRERLRALLMLALYRMGRQAEALQTFREARVALVEELGIEPSAELRELHEAILAQEPSLLRPAVHVDRARVDEVRPAGAERVPAPEAAHAPREERKMVTVLVAEHVGFEGWARGRDPEDVRAQLAPYQRRLRLEIERFDGTVEKFIGGAVIALFGAPTAHEDDPERAVRAALGIRDWAAERAEGGVRLAVHTEEALVTVGSESNRTEVMTAGDLVSTARRIQDAAPPNGVLVGQRTYWATRDSIEYGPAETVDAGSPVRVWHAIQARSRPVSFAETRSPLVGRARELELLTSTLARARDEKCAQLVTVVGVPGIGKSRLVYELHRGVELEPELITWRHGRSLPYGQGVTFWALGEMVKQQAGILESDSAEDAAAKLTSAVRARVGEDADWIEAQLRPLVGLGSTKGTEASSGEGPNAWRRFFEALAEQRPTVLVFEDLHWADDGLLDFIDQLVDRATDVPLLVLATARPDLIERRPGWGAGKRNALVLSLSPLADEETARLVASLLEGASVEATTLSELVGRVGGNPLYAEQYARALLERGGLEQPPETVQGIIAARLDALSDEEKRLLQDSAVVGSVFWLGAVEALDGCSRSHAEELLHGLGRKEFVRRVRRSSVASEAEYAFRHVLLRDIAYGQIPRAGRAEKHERTAAWIESLGRSEDHAEMLAYHYLSALEYGKATGRESSALAKRARVALRAAGDRALALASYSAAARYYGAALELWPDRDPDRVWVLVGTGRARFWANRTGITLLEEGVEQLESCGDSDGAAHVAVELARFFWIGGDRDAAYTYIDRALHLTENRPSSRARAYALVERAAYHMNASEEVRASNLLHEALPLTEALGMDELRVRALDVRAWSRMYSGDLDGVDDSKRAIELARESNALYRLIVAELNLQVNQFFVGKPAKASEALRLAQRDVESYGTADQRNWLRVAQAHDAMMHGRWDEASDHVDEMFTDREALDTRYMADPVGLAIRATIELARGDVNAASASSQTALERARRAKDPQILAPAILVRSTVMLAQGQRDPASRLAMELLDQGSVSVLSLLLLHPAATPIELAWLARDLGLEAELMRVLRAAPENPWLTAASAIVNGDLAAGVELVAHIGAPSIEAYTRLRAAQAMVAASQHADARPQLETALAFYQSVRATRYIDQAKAAITATHKPSARTSARR